MQHVSTEHLVGRTLRAIQSSDNVDTIYNGSVSDNFSGLEVLKM